MILYSFDIYIEIIGGRRPAVCDIQPKTPDDVHWQKPRGHSNKFAAFSSKESLMVLALMWNP